MTEEEFASILNHLRRRMSQLDLGELDARISGDVRALQDDPEQRVPASQLLLRYLSFLENAMELNAFESANAILRRLQTVARTEDGGLIRGIELRLSDTDQTLFGVQQDTIDLVALPELEDLMEELRALRAYLAEQLDNPE